MILLIVFKTYFSAYNNPILHNDVKINTVIIPDQVQPALRDAINDLRSVILKMTGKSLNVICDSEAISGPAIYISNTANTEINTIFDEEKILLESRDDSFIIEGSNDGATANAIYYFLEKIGGLKWYMPTSIGEHIPLREFLEIPVLTETVEPDFESRHLSGLKTTDELIWYKRNRLKIKYNYNHNLFRVFTKELFKIYPEFFPEIRGKVISPSSDKDQGWQPEFLNESAADYAAKTVIEYFNENPDEISFSLGINDSIGFDQGELTQSFLSPLSGYRNRPDLSGLYFTFLNRVALQVQNHYPGNFIGCLAYNWCLNVPSFRVQENIIPYVASDRSQWFDKNRRSDDILLLQDWLDSGVDQIGVFDYYDSHNYYIPRIFHSLLIESLNKYNDLGIQAFHGTLYPVWGFSSARPWLVSRMLWDMESDPDMLLDQYYDDFFGSAAPYLKRFDLECEKQWMKQKGAAVWLKYYADESQADLFPPELCERLQSILSEALISTDNSLVKLRIAVIVDAFELTTLASNLYHIKKRVYFNSCKTKDALMELKDDLLRALELKEKIISHLKKSFMNSTINLKNTNVLTVMASEVERLALFKVAKNGLLNQENYEDLSSLLAGQKAELLLEDLYGLREIFIDEVGARVVAQFKIDLFSNFNAGIFAHARDFISLKRVEGKSEGFTQVADVDWFIFEKEIDIPEGDWLKVETKARNGFSPGCTVVLKIESLDAKGKRLGMFYLRLPQSEMSIWQDIGHLFQLIEDSKRIRVSIAVRGQNPGADLSVADFNLSVLKGNELRGSRKP